MRQDNSTLLYIVRKRRNCVSCQSSGCCLGFILLPGVQVYHVGRLHGPLGKHHFSLHGDLPGRAVFFTDGSASPPEFAGVRISTWSVVHAKDNPPHFQKILAGLTPGLVHTIARAETFAALQAIQISPTCDLYVDNQGVFLNFTRIHQSGYQPLEWKNQVNGDL